MFCPDAGPTLPEHASGMEFNPSDLRDDSERSPAQGFQSEGAEHAPDVMKTPPAEGPAAAYQHEDDEFIWPTD